MKLRWNLMGLAVTAVVTGMLAAGTESVVLPLLGGVAVGAWCAGIESMFTRRRRG